jgi:tyrosyl-DNA phosphodiesterase 2
MAHLKELFGDPPPPLVIMLQEVHYQSLAAILAHSWIRNNFVLSNVDAPQRYFTLMMVSQDTPAENWFRIPFQSQMERDALVVDIPISPLRESNHFKKCLRLCTTHLESLPEFEGKELRPRQLAQVSALLKAPSTHCVQIIGGLVGGDMNPISPLDAASHKSDDVDLCDVWEDTTPPPIPARKLFRKDLTYGRARGNTWGYQSQSARSRKRLDKFFYTGLVDVVALAEAQDLTGKVGRLGIDVKTKVEAWEYEMRGLRSVQRRLVEKIDKRYFDTEMELLGKAFGGGVRKEIDIWVSDHFGIAVGIRVR